MDERQTPVFVKLSEYKELTEILSLARDGIQKCKAVLTRIHDIKAQEDAILDSWQTELNDIDGKVEDVDKRLMEPDV
jgi:predicted translin family RNA/ssDNA-binding protein